MLPPIQISQWLRKTYPKPQVDPEWLDGCYSWIESEFHFDPATQMDQIIEHVNTQLLESDLTDSMVAGTGLPENVADLNNTIIRGSVLLQIVSITEIGHSAFSLQNVRQARLERADMAGLIRDEDDEDEGPIPNYPRSMLKFHLSDGSTVVEAIEYRRLPDLVLGETKLGCKMLLKDVSIRRGIAFLEPKCIVMKGHQAAELAALQDVDFARSLRLRLGQPEDPAQQEPEPEPPAEAPAPAPRPAPRGNSRAVSPPSASLQTRQQRAPAPHVQSPIRSPLRELSDPPTPPIAGPSGTFHDDDEGQPRRRKVPSRSQRSPSPMPPARASTHSRYFSAGPTPNAGSASQPRMRNPSADIARERLLSPHRQPPVVVPDSDEEEALWGPPSNPASAAAGLSRKPSVAREEASPKAQSSEYDFDDDTFVNEAFLAEVDRVEREALAKEGLTPRVASMSGTIDLTQRSAAGSTQRTLIGTNLPGSSSGPGTLPRSTVASRSGSATQGAPERIDLGMITIEDSDEDDKENVPAITRRVRQRTSRSVASSQSEVIELSD